MKASDIYGSKYLSAQDIPDGGLTSTIEAVNVEKFRNDREGLREKIVLALQDVKKFFAVNATNALYLIDKLGDDFQEWVGHVVKLVVKRVLFQGKLVNGISVVKVDDMPE